MIMKQIARTNSFMCFDAIIFSLQRNGGISVVWYELLKRFADDVPIDYSVLFYEGENNWGKLLREHTRDNSISMPSSLIPAIRYLPIHLNHQSSPFLFHSSYYRTCNNKNAINITTVHDFTYEYYSDGIRKTLHHNQKQSAIKKADAIICISNNTKRDLLSFYPNIEPGRIRVIYNGVSDDYKIIPKDPNGLPFPSQSFILYVGGREKYKNYEVAVKAAESCKMNLVIVGRELSKDEEILTERYLSKNEYIVLSGVSNTTLNTLYNHAFCLLYPSMYEGFGIPILESQRAGCPVIAMNRSSIPEVIGDSPLLLQTSDSNEVIQKINLLHNKEVRNNIVEHGLSNSLRFSWDRMYNEYRDLYLDLLTTGNNK